MSYEVKQFLK